MLPILKALERRFLSKKPVVVLLGFVVALALGVSDQSSGPDLSFLVFYLLPVLFVSWYAGAGAGFFISLAGTVIWFLANDVSSFDWRDPVIPYWNAAGRLAMFVMVAYVMARLRLGYEREKSLSRTDYLTGVANRRFLMEQLDLELARVRRYRGPLTLVLMDVDNFKQVNDDLGHEMGDRALQAIAHTLRANTRRTDLIARLGGDEFALLLPETSREAAESFLPRIVERLADVAAANGWRIGFSVGVVTAATPPPALDDLIRTADELMYSVKRTGKSQICYQVLRGDSEANPERPALSA